MCNAYSLSAGSYYVPTMQQQPRSYYSQMAPVRPRWNPPAVQPRFGTVPPGGQQVRQQVSSRPITGQPNANQPRMAAAAAAPQVRPPMAATAQNIPRPSYKYAAAVRNNPPAAQPAQQVRGGCNTYNDKIYDRIGTHVTYGCIN